MKRTILILVVTAVLMSSVMSLGAMQGRHMSGIMAPLPNSITVSYVEDDTYPDYFSFDYGVVPEDIVLSDPTPEVGDTVKISATIHNYGISYIRAAWGWYSRPGDSAWVEYDFNYPSDETVDIVIRAGDDTDITVPMRVKLDGVQIAQFDFPAKRYIWKKIVISGVSLTEGHHTIYVSIINANSPPSRDLDIDYVKVGSVRMEAETFDRSGGNDPNSHLRGWLIIRNNLVARFYCGDPSAGGTQIGSVQIVGDVNKAVVSVNYGPTTVKYIENDGSAVASIDWTVTQGCNCIYVKADPDNVFNEIDETNNVAHTGLGALAEWLPPLSHQNRWNAGSTIPIKFSACGCDGVPFKDTGVLVTVKDSEGNTVAAWSYVEKNPNEGVVVRDHYHVNWHTDGLPSGDYFIKVTLSSGATLQKTITLV